MSATLEGQITYEEFKQMAADFLLRCKATPAPTEAQLSNGLHMLRIGYLSLKAEDYPIWEGSAFILVQMAERKAYEIAGVVI